MPDLAGKLPQQFNIVEFANRLVLKQPPLPLFPEASDDVAVFIRALDGQLTKLHQDQRLLLPNLHEDVESIAVFSDYAGDQSAYLTYSFLAVGWNALAAFFQQTTAMRARHELGGKEIGFKDFGFGPQARALDDFLQAAEHVPGLLFTLIVEKSVVSALAGNNKRTLEDFTLILKNEGLGEWKGAVAERLLRIVHTVSYLVALLAREGHKVIWMTDDDAIAPNAEKADALGRLLGRIMRQYAKVDYGTIGYALPFKPEKAGQPDLRDLLSITDLAAGCVAHFYNEKEKSQDPRIREQANRVLLWMSRQGIGLKRLNFVVRPSRDDKNLIETAIAEFVPKEAAEVTNIPVYV